MTEDEFRRYVYSASFFADFSPRRIAKDRIEWVVYSIRKSKKPFMLSAVASDAGKGVIYRGSFTDFEGSVIMSLKRSMTLVGNCTGYVIDVANELPVVKESPND